VRTSLSLLSAPFAPPYHYSFFFLHTSPSEIYTLSLHDALPISHLPAGVARAAAQRARPVHHGGSLVGRDLRVQRNHLLQRKAGLLSRVSRLADPHARPARAGGLPR